jgi:glycosyltransferase involved in cell wall biosynthesis
VRVPWFRRFAWSVHDRCRTLLWLAAPSIRRVIPGRRPWRSASKALHVTTSFDLGGTQMQIKHLATAADTRLTHGAVELFPELNYLFRRGVSVQAANYVRGGPLARIVGRCIVNRSRRGSHLVQIAKLVRDFRREQPDVVVGWGHEICVITFVAAVMARVPRIVFCIRTVNPTYGWTDPAFATLLRAAHHRMSGLVDRIIVNSTFLQRDHAAWLESDEQRIAVCANGIEVEAVRVCEPAVTRARLRRHFGIADDAIVISNVGRFSAEKGQRSLIDANRHLLDRTSAPVMWLLGGDGPTLASVQSAASEQGMSNIVFVGRTDAVGDILAASDIFVMPSDYEGMPTAMMEAMAAGLPCVSTRLSGATDIARDGVDALFFDAGDAAALAGHLLRLIENPSWAHELGERAAARAREFDVTRFVRHFDRLLLEALSQSIDE